jgi:hypothetical protein
MEYRLLRAAYTIEFLVALVATFEFWSQVGGQSHLDLMPWWWKGILALAIATSIVKVTMAGQRRQMLIWVLVLAFLLFGGGITTYYFHLYEPQDESVDEEHLTPTSLPLSPERHLHLPRTILDIHQHRPIVL